MFKPSDEELVALRKNCEYLLFLQNVFTRDEIWEELDLESYDERLMAVFGCLFLIRDENYRTGDCFEQDIKRGLYDFLTTYMDKEVTLEDAGRLASHFIWQVFQNDGHPFERSLKDISNLTYINFSNKLNSDGKDKETYNLELMMEEYLFLISGVQRYFDVEIQQIIFNERITQKDYKNAVEDAEAMYRGLQANTNYLKIELERQKRNPYDYDYQKFEQVIDERKLTIQQTIEKFQGYKAKVKADMDQIEDIEFNITYQNLSEQQKENLDYQEKIQATLDYCLRLLTENYDIYCCYGQNIDRSLEEQLDQMFDDEEYFPFNEVYQTVLATGEALVDGRFMAFTAPLFMKKPPIIYNPALALQEVYSHDKKEHPDREDEDILMDDPAVEAQRQAQIRDEQEQKEQPYRQLLFVILRLLAEYQEVSFTDLEELLANDEERDLFCEHKLIFMIIAVELIALAMKGYQLDRSKEVGKLTEIPLTTGLSIDIVKIMVEVLEANPTLRNIQKIRFETNLDEEINVFDFGFSNVILQSY